MRISIFAYLLLNKKVLAYLYLLIVFMQVLNGQKQFTGSVIDQQGESVPYANVILKDATDSSYVKGISADSIGFFKCFLENGSLHFIEVSAIGFENKTIALIETQNHYEIKLDQAYYGMDEIKIQARRSLYELKEDRLVFNVGSIPTFGGDNALQVLQKSPGVQVNENGGTIGLNNKGQVLMMINDRIVRIPMNLLIAQLRSIPAENIERIEIIHQPPPKYDADNASGIIHIV
ncbi:carboxypeptidase-like regulatory domain-containing protein [Portibacter marinus]|uniref:carboxypeptidase-like regulatory domain-containing protein n=1 Tax=Portibacter marinus TaxID=2898660 RepID=UPI001F3E8E1F|nr:TonB-dependent receptor plug domain-containing protein [Portibacter marinus]